MKRFLKFCFLFLIFSCSTGSENNGNSVQINDFVSPLKNETVVRFDVSVNTGNPNITGDVGRDLVDKGLIILPVGYSSKGDAVKLVIYCHGGGGTVSDNGSESESDNYCRFLSSLGYAVLDVNGIPKQLATELKIDGGRTVGNFIALRSYVAGYDYVKENFNIDPNGCYVFANSNGGLICMNLANLSAIPIVAQAGVCPMLSLERNLWNYSAGTISSAGGEFSSLQNRANIIRLYGMKDVNAQQELNNAVYERNKVGDFDPFDYLMNKSTNDYSVPFKIFQTKDDWAVNFSITKELVDSMQKRGGNMILREFNTGGHTPEPQKGIVGTYKYHFNNYPLTRTVLEASQWFEEKQGYEVNYSK